jgi:hypothetical protein
VGKFSILTFNGMPMKIDHFFLIALASIFSLAPLTSHAQGSLIPPGAPGPTMLTLSQVQPRVPVDAVHTPGNASTEFLINNPGSYYLTTNIIGVSSEYGIEITANNVTLDLNGFSMIGPASANTGIFITSGVTNPIVRNGSVNGWSSINDGILSFGNNTVIENVSVSGGATGIGCLGSGGVIRDCAVNLSDEDGLYLGGPGYLVYGNTFSGNNTVNEGNGAAIFINASGNRIENNFVVGSGPAGFGILINVAEGYTNNVVVRNSVQGNGANDFYFNSAQLTGPLITGVSLGIITNSSPWANFAF